MSIFLHLHMIMKNEIGPSLKKHLKFFHHFASGPPLLCRFCLAFIFLSREKSQVSHQQIVQEKEFQAIQDRQAFKVGVYKITFKVWHIIKTFFYQEQWLIQTIQIEKGARSKKCTQSTKYHPARCGNFVVIVLLQQILEPK